MSTPTVTRRAALAAAAVAPAALATPALAQTKRLRLVTSWSEALPLLPQSAARLAATVESLSGGALAMEVVNAGPDHGAFDVLDLVGRGEADAYHSLEQNWQDKHPAYAYFTTVPFGLTAEEMASWLAYGGGEPLWRELAAQNRVHPIAVGNTGCQMGGWFAEKVTSLDKLGGGRMNAAGIGGKVWKAAGLDTVSLAGDDLVLSMFDGDVKAIEWFSPHLDLDFGFAKLLPYFMFPGWQEPGDTIALGVSAPIYDGFSDEEKALLEIACRQESVVVSAEFLAENGRSLNIMRTEYGSEIEPFPQDVLDRLFEISEGVLEEIAAYDDLSRRVHESFSEFRGSTARYSDISTGKFVSLRNNALGLNEAYPAL
ncbi:MAG: hypothetical protein AAF360_08320 [Pseudomonadota bacterium]